MDLMPHCDQTSKGRSPRLEVAAARPNSDPAGPRVRRSEAHTEDRSPHSRARIRGKSHEKACSCNRRGSNAPHRNGCAGFGPLARPSSLWRPGHRSSRRARPVHGSIGRRDRPAGLLRTGLRAAGVLLWTPVLSDCPLLSTRLPLSVPLVTGQGPAPAGPCQLVSLAEGTPGTEGSRKSSVDTTQVRTRPGP